MPNILTDKDAHSAESGVEHRHIVTSRDESLFIEDPVSSEEELSINVDKSPFIGTKREIGRTVI